MDISRFRTFRRDALRLERVERPLKFSCNLGLLLLPFVPASSSPVHPFMSLQICHKRTFRMSSFVVSSKHLFFGVSGSVKSCRADPAGFPIVGIRERSTGWTRNYWVELQTAI